MIVKFEAYKYKNYPYDDMVPFIRWFGLRYLERMKKEGWLIATVYHDSLHNLAEFGVNGYGDFWEVEGDDEQLIITDTETLYDLAGKTGLMTTDGIIIGYDGISFLTDSKYLDSFAEKLKTEQDSNKFGI